MRSNGETHHFNEIILGQKELYIGKKSKVQNKFLYNKLKKFKNREIQLFEEVKCKKYFTKTERELKAIK